MNTSLAQGAVHAFLGTECNLHADVPTLVAALKNGEMIILVDDEDRENEGDLIISADHISPEAIAFMATKGCGLICLALTQEQADKMELSMQPKRHVGQLSSNFTVSIEARRGVGSGISAADRAHTVRVAASANVTADDIALPGHVFPIVARAGGTLAREGHTEASVDFMQLAGLTPAGVICEVMNPDGTMARLPELEHFARQYGMKIGRICDLVAYRRQNPDAIAPLGFEKHDA